MDSNNDKKQYNHHEIEKKWQDYWTQNKTYKTDLKSDKPKKFVLDMFPYPSGAGLHVGHPRGYIATDVYSRKAKMEGFEVLHPMGWDAFGLPAENFAIKNKTHPKIQTDANIANYKSQLAKIGMNYDWDHEINTTDPEFYHWTQWMFLQMVKKGLAFESNEPINWCPGCQTGLANEDLESDGTCERCGSASEKKAMRQWVLKITKYADRLIEDLDTLPKWPQYVKEAQRNWIGKREGARVVFDLTSAGTFEFPEKVLLATGNKSKVSRFTELLASKIPGTTLVSLGDAGISDMDVAEDGTVSQNALVKARAYKSKTDMPTMATDTGLFLDGNLIDPARVKRTALEAAGVSENAPQGVIAKAMEDYYKNIAKENGGALNGYFLDAVAYIDENGLEAVQESKRHITLTDILHETEDIYFPIMRLYAIKPSNVSYFDASNDQKRQWLAPLQNSLVSLLRKAKPLAVFTTRPDTLYGATYVVLAPEHAYVSGLISDSENPDEIKAYIEEAALKSEIERTREDKEKTGVKLEGVFAVHPITGEKLPTYIADYVLAGYGEGAIMAVPAHDERDAAFAKKYAIQIKKVVSSEGGSGDEIHSGDGVLVNSGEHSGKEAFASKAAICAQAGGELVSNYRLKDWVFSRQRYWGEPIPMVHYSGKAYPLDESELPLRLPQVESYAPTGTGESPLADIKEWVNVKGYLTKEGTFISSEVSPEGQEIVEVVRETNTMPQWAGSSWYYLRFIDPKNTQNFIDQDIEKKWMDVDVYVGGDHATRHLIYARFWHKVLHDIGVVSTLEPFPRLEFLGFILAGDGTKMSKSKGNVINPDSVIDTVGADAFRTFEMFIAPFENATPWSTDGLAGTRRFIEKVWRVQSKITDSENLEIKKLLHKTIKKVSQDIEGFKFNTAVSSLMILVNAMDKADSFSKKSYEDLLKILAPFAPHVTEELWQKVLGNTGTIHHSAWPKHEESLTVETESLVGVQVNGKVRGQVLLALDASEDTAKQKALALEGVAKHVAGGEIKKFFYKPGKIISIVV